MNDLKTYKSKKKRRRTISDGEEEEKRDVLNITTENKTLMTNPFAEDQQLFQENISISIQAEAEQQISSPIRTSFSKQKSKHPRTYYSDSSDETYEPTTTTTTATHKKSSSKKPSQNNSNSNTITLVESQSQRESSPPKKQEYQKLFETGLIIAHEKNTQPLIYYKIVRCDQQSRCNIAISFVKDGENQRVSVTIQEAIIYSNNEHVTLIRGTLSKDIFDTPVVMFYIFEKGSKRSIYYLLKDQFTNVRIVEKYSGPDFEAEYNHYEKHHQSPPKKLPQMTLSFPSEETPKKYNTRSGQTHFSSTPAPTKEILNHFGISVTNRDLERLAPDEFLNDNLIDFYLKHLECSFVNNRELKNQVVIFNTLFYPILGRNIERARKIPSNNNIFDKKYVFIPINESAHWTLCVLLNPGEAIEKAIICAANKNNTTAKSSTTSSTPHRSKSSAPRKHTSCIMIMDSLGGPASSHLSCVKRIRNYLNARYMIEMEKQGKTNIPKAEFTREALPQFMAKVPGQNNSSDCGVFILQYVEMILHYLPVEFPISDQKWFDPNYIATKRERIKELIEAYKMRTDSGDETKLNDLLKLLENDLESVVKKSTPTLPATTNNATTIDLDEEDENSLSNENIVEDDISDALIDDLNQEQNENFNLVDDFL